MSDFQINVKGRTLDGNVDTVNAEDYLKVRVLGMSTKDYMDIHNIKKADLVPVRAFTSVSELADDMVWEWDKKYPTRVFLSRMPEGAVAITDYRFNVEFVGRDSVSYIKMFMTQEGVAIVPIKENELGTLEEELGGAE